MSLDKSGQGVLIVFPTEEVPNRANDPQLREMTCDPSFRKILISDGQTGVGQAVVRALIAAGADLVWMSQAEPWKASLGLEQLKSSLQVAIVPLDLPDSSSVTEAAGSIGARVDIVINTAEVHRAHGIASRSRLDMARDQMDINYFGLLRLAQAFRPTIKARAADGAAGAAAWVNLLSIYALCNCPPHGTYSASKTAALSPSQCLRAEMRPAGIRVIKVFPQLLDDEWNQTLPPPKLAPDALAEAVGAALRDGVEDVYPGDVAQECLERWQGNPKVLERELSADGR